MSKRYLGIIPREHRVIVVNAVESDNPTARGVWVLLNWEGQENFSISRSEFNSRFKCEGMDFSLALTGMRLGLKMRRSEWPPEMSMYLEDGTLFGRDEDGDYEFEGDCIDGPTIEDILATDWEIVQ